MQKTESLRCLVPSRSATPGVGVSSERKGPDPFFVAVLLGVALAIGVYLIATSVVISKDGVFYIEQAQRLAQDPLGAARRYPIGYPLLIVAGHKVASLLVHEDGAAVWIVSAQAVTLLCRLGAVVFLYLLGWMWVGARASFWAVLIVLVLPYPAHYGCDVLREWPFVLFLAAGFWLLLCALRDETWWLFGLVGLVAGLGYLIRPMCGQLVVYALLGLAVVAWKKQPRRAVALFGASGLLLSGFALVAVPYSIWVGTAIPHQFRSLASNWPPTITAVGSKSAGVRPLSFAIRAGATFEATITASDFDGDVLAVSVVSVPPGTRPVYRLRSAKYAIDFWTTSDSEKEALLAYGPDVWRYEGIDCYAYTDPGVALGLAPVYRLWSPVQNRHFYTIDASERLALLERASKDQWQNEGVAFYAFPPGQAPPGAVAVRRVSEGLGRYSWRLERTSGGDDARPGEVVWYVPQSGAPPVGSVLDGRVFRWRPEAEQRGEYWLNVVVSDGELENCQIVRIVVDGRKGEEATGPERPSVETVPENAAATTTGPPGVPPANEAPAASGMRLLPAAVAKTLGGIGENLMVFFLVPLCLGLYWRLRYEAGRQERVLTAAVLTVNIALMLGRHMWIAPGSARRYSIGLIVLTACYIPTGLVLLAGGLRRVGDRLFGDRGQAERGEKVWFIVLLAVGMAICVPKLLKPMGFDKTGYRDVAQWLRHDTDADAVVAVPDERVGLYAERPRRLYREGPDPRGADYVVVETGQDDSPRVVEGWVERYSAWISERHRGRLVIYKVVREDRPGGGGAGMALRQ